MSNTKILSELTENNLFDISIKSLKDTDLQSIFKLDNDDNTQSVKNRIIYHFFKSMLCTNTIPKIENVLYSCYSQDFLKYLAGQIKFNSESTNFLDLAQKCEYEPVVKAKALKDYIEIKLEFNKILAELYNPIEINLENIAAKFTELDKKIVSIFSNIQSYFNSALNIDVLRDQISLNILQIKLEMCRKGNDKQKFLKNIYEEVKVNRQKKIIYLQNLLPKISEQIANHQSKIMVNSGKMKVIDLVKSTQTFLKYNEEINILNDKLINQKTLDQRNDIILQLEKKLNLVTENIKIIKDKAPQGLKDDLSQLLYLHELQSYHKNRVVEINNLIESSSESFLNLINQISSEEKRFSSMNVYSVQDISYSLLRNYIENNLNPNQELNLNIDIKSDFSICKFSYNDLEIYGIIQMSITYQDKNFFLELSEKNLFSKIFSTHSYKFDDIDRMVRFIINGFKK